MNRFLTVNRALLRLVIFTGVPSIAVMLLLLHAVRVQDDLKYEQRMTSAKTVSSPWDRYVALNHDWSPGAWCFSVPDSKIKTQWQVETEEALKAALRAEDSRAMAYLYSPEAHWFCLDELRAQHPRLQ